jgi:hypothetical protein
MDKFLPKKPVKKQEDLELLLLRFICGCDLSLSILERKEFIDLMQFLDPHVRIPCTKTLTTRILPNACSSIEDELKELGHSCRAASFTTDIWSQHRIGFLTVTCHFLTKDFKMVSRNLGIQEFSASDHSGHAIDAALRAFQQEYFGPNAKALGSITHDAASNMIAATRTLECEQLLCINHALHNSVCRTFEDGYPKDLVSKATDLVTHFRSSCKSTEELKRQQSTSIKLTVRPCNNTRWNSVLEMLTVLHKLRQPLQATLIQIQRRDLDLEEGMWASVPILCDALLPFQEATTALSSEDATLSMVPAVLHSLQLNILSLSDELDWKGKLRGALVTNFNDYLAPHLYPTSAATMAAALDPRNRALEHLQQDEAESVWGIIEDRILASINDASKQTHPSTVTSAQSHQQHPKPFKKIRLSFSSQCTETPRSIRDEVKQKISYYRSLFVDHRVNSLEFWKLHAVNLSQLLDLALRFAVMQPTSTASERTFSLAGNIFNDRRGRLSTISLHRLLLFKQNDKVLRAYRAEKHGDSLEDNVELEVIQIDDDEDEPIED